VKSLSKEKQQTKSALKNYEWSILRAETPKIRFHDVDLDLRVKFMLKSYFDCARLENLISGRVEQSLKKFWCRAIPIAIVEWDVKQIGPVVRNIQVKISRYGSGIRK
jgi:hypothetical protein